MYKHFCELLASERSERDITQSKIGDVCLLASETLLGVDNAKSGICYNAKSGICYMYICMWDGTYAL